MRGGGLRSVSNQRKVWPSVAGGPQYYEPCHPPLPTLMLVSVEAGYLVSNFGNLGDLSS